VPASSVGVNASVVDHDVRTGISADAGGDIGPRLLEPGFVEGGPLRVIAHGYPGR